MCDGSVCVDAESLTAQCTGGQTADLAAGGPTIFAVDVVATGLEGETCDSTNTYLASVYSPTAFDTSLNSQRLKFISADGVVSGTYSDTVGNLPEVEAIEGAEGYYTVTFYLCGDGGAGAVQLSNNDSDLGNAFCMDLQVE